MPFVATGSTARVSGQPSKARRRMVNRLTARGWWMASGKEQDVSVPAGFRRPGSQNRRKH